jgi:hypothetical protein
MAIITGAEGHLDQFTRADPTDLSETDEPFEGPDPLDQLEAELAEVCGHLNALHARLVELTASALESGAWSQWGIHTPSHWLAWKAGLSRSHALTVVRLAIRRAELPATFHAFERGELSIDQVAPIVAKAPAWADHEVCEFAKHATVTQLRSTLASYAFHEVGSACAGITGEPAAGEPATSETGDGEPGGETVTIAPNDAGRWRINGELDADHGLLVDAAMRELHDALFGELGRVPTGAEVLVEMAQRSLDRVEGAARRDRYRVHVHLDERHELLDPHGHCLPTWVRELITCDTTASVLWTRHGTPIATGDTKPTIPAAIRRHVLLRDRSCRVPGCQARRRLDVHHVVHREHHGTNDPWNLAAICPRHHRMHHRGQLGITGNAETPGGLTFTDHRGREMLPASSASPPTGPPPRPAGRYQHASGESLQPWSVHFNRPGDTAA